MRRRASIAGVTRSVNDVVVAFREQNHPIDVIDLGLTAVLYESHLGHAVEGANGILRRIRDRAIHFHEPVALRDGDEERRLRWLILRGPTARDPGLPKKSRGAWIFVRGHGDFRHAPVSLTHIAFDTSMLIGSGWPHLSTALQNVLRAARELEIGILLPELVLWEAEAAWFETTRDGVEQFPKRMTTF